MCNLISHMPSDQPTFISASDETLDLPAGKNILSCNATGNPLPSYHWQFPQAAQETYKDQDVNYPILTGPFEFPGVYTCTASNSQGTVTKYFTVNKPPGKFSSVNSVHFPSCYILSSMIFFYSSLGIGPGAIAAIAIAAIVFVICTLGVIHHKCKR